MSKIGNLISKLQIDGKTFKNPEWWSTKHKLKCNVRDNEEFVTRVDLKKSYQVNSETEMPSDLLISEMRAALDSPRFSEFAPWNPVFRKSNPIITLRKEKVVKPDVNEIAESVESGAQKLDINA